MRVAVIGNRDITDKKVIQDIINSFFDDVQSDYYVFLFGGARGVQDIVAEYISPMYNCTKVTFKPWHLVDFDMKFTSRLFVLRNKQIINNSDKVLFIRNGTADGEVSRSLEYALEVKSSEDVEVFDI